MAEDALENAGSGPAGGLEVWDRRQGGGAPAQRSPLGWGATGCPSLRGLTVRSLCHCVCLGQVLPHKDARLCFTWRACSK